MFWLMLLEAINEAVQSFQLNQSTSKFDVDDTIHCSKSWILLYTVALQGPGRCVNYETSV